MQILFLFLIIKLNQGLSLHLLRHFLSNTFHQQRVAESGFNEMAPKAATGRTSRNPDLIRGVGKFSRSKMYHKRGLWAIKAKNGGVFPKHDPKPAAAETPAKPPKFYPADDVKKPLANKRKHKPTKLRSSFFIKIYYFAYV